MGLLQALNLPPPPPPKPHASAPSPEAIRVTKHVKALLLELAALDAAKAPEAPHIRAEVMAVAKSAAHAKGVAQATIRLKELDVEVARAKAGREKAAAEAAAPKERHYTLPLGRQHLVDATETEACKQAKVEYDHLEAELKRGVEAHCHSLKIQQEEAFASWISSKLNMGSQMPALEIWDSARDHLASARHALNKRDIDALPSLFDAVKDSTEKGLKSIGKFTESSIQSAERAVKVLEKTKDLSSKVIVKAAERMGGKEAGVAVGAMYASVLEGAQQMSAVHLAKIQKEVDWSLVQTQGITEFVKGMVELLMTGALAPRFAKIFGAYLGKADFSEKALLEMGHAVGLDGPLPRDYLATAGQKFVTKFLTARAVGLVKNAIDAMAKVGTKNKEPKVGIEEAMHRIVENAVTDKLLDKFAEFLVGHAVEA